MNLVPLHSDTELKSQVPASEAGILGIRPEDFEITQETMAGGVAFGLTVEAIEKVGAETFVYGTREREVQGVASNPGELPPGRGDRAHPRRGGARDRRANQGRPRRGTSCICSRPTGGNGSKFDLRHAT